MHKLIIDANHKRLGLVELKELYAYKDLFIILAYRDLRVRYAQTFLGLLWAVLQPLFTLLIFVLIFGKGMKIETGSVPYPLFALAGLSTWTYFAFVVNQVGNSIINAQGMIQKIYFPRLIIPLSKAVVGLVDFAVTLILIVCLMLWYRYIPSANIIFLPVFMLFTVCAALGVGIWLSALTIRYRDFQHIVPFLVQFGLYATPIAYPVNVIPSEYQLLYHINPMAGIVTGFRWSLLGGDPPALYMYVSIMVAVVLFLSGLLYFKQVEKVMADIV